MSIFKVKGYLWNSIKDLTKAVIVYTVVRLVEILPLKLDTLLHQSGLKVTKVAGKSIRMVVHAQSLTMVVRKLMTALLGFHSGVVAVLGLEQSTFPLKSVRNAAVRIHECICACRYIRNSVLNIWRCRFLFSKKSHSSNECNKM